MSMTTILVVEDDAVLAYQLLNVLTRMGFAPAGPFAAGEEAVEAMEREGADLVLMDIELAGDMDGIAAAEAIACSHDVPILFMTGHSRDFPYEQAKNVVPYGYLIKPVSARELATAVEMALHRHSLDRRLKESQAALERSEAKYRRLFESLPIGIFRTGLNGSILDGNSEMARLVGCASPEEVLGHFTDMPRQLYVEPHRRNELLARLRENGAVDNFEILARRKGGEACWLSINARINTDDSGEQAIEGFAQDITVRKRAEHSLRESEERYRTISSLTTDIAYSCSARNGGGFAIDWIVGAVEEITGHTPEELRRHLCWRFLVVEEDIPLFERNVTGIAPGESSSCELRLRRKDGTLRWVECMTMCAPAEEGSGGRRVFGTIVDRTDRKNLKDTLRLVAESGLAPGQDIFRFLVRNLAVALEKRYVLLSRIFKGDPKTGHTLAAWQDGHFADNFSYPLADTPCEHVAARGACFYPSEIRTLFPRDPLLTLMEAESYRGVPLYDAGGNLLGLLSVMDDRPMEKNPADETLLATFAARAAAELERRSTEENYQVLFREMLDGFAVHEIICDADGVPADYRFLAVNPAYERITGLKGEKILGKTVLEVMPGLDRHWIDIYGRVALTGKPAYFTSHEPTIGKHFEVTAYRTEQNMFACIVKDVSDRKRAEETLRQSEQRFRLLVEGSADAIFVQVGMRFAYLNQAAVLLYGAQEAADLLGTPVMDRFHVSFHARIRERIRLLIEGKRVAPQIEQIHLRLDGSAIPVEVSAAPILFEGNEGALVFVRDITERKRMQEEQAKLREQLLHAQRMEDIGRLSGGIAHDFNNHLTAIIGCSQMLLNRLPADSDLRAFAEMVCSAGEKASVLTRSLLTFSRRQPPEMRPLDLNVVSANLTRLMRRLIGEDIELLVESGGDALLVNGDAGQIEQVLMNLATNARDAMPDGGTIRIGLSRRWLDGGSAESAGLAKPGGYAEISFSDTGAGVPAEIRDRIFEPFFTSKDLGKGTGLGLSIIDGIIRQHQGRIWLESGAGPGATFTILLPLTDCSRPDAEPELPSAVAGGTETVLFCEDDCAVRNLIALVLRGAGYHVLEAEDGEQAVEMFRLHQDRVALVVLDVVMPKKNGVVAYGELEALKPGVKVLFTSGYTPDSINRSGVFEMKLPFIQKPITPALLLRKVRETLDGQ